MSNSQIIGMLNRAPAGGVATHTGVDELTIQRILRHANVATTRKHYTKVRNPKLKAALRMLDASTVR